MLKFFRALGGVCENVFPAHGHLGRGLLAKDPERPVKLRLPESLVFRVDDVEFVEGHLRLKPTTNVMDAPRAFFERYQAAFSWGGGGSAESADFIENLDRLPPEVREVLTEDFGFGDLFEGDPATRAQRWFLDSRSIQINRMHSVAPLIELANHNASGLSFEFEHGVQITGPCAGEVLVARGAHDPLSFLRTFGFASPEPGAFSILMNVVAGRPEIRIGRDFGRVLKRGKVWVPQIDRIDGAVELSHLMIGHAIYSRLSRGIFHTLMREAQVSDPDENFDRILNFNWRKFLNLLAVLEPHDGETITLLRRTARYQLEAMSNCVGSREPEMQERPAEQVWQFSIQ
jgi:hypothetical protein